jgi:hypothetical protein
MPAGSTVSPVKADQDEHDDSDHEASQHAVASYQHHEAEQNPDNRRPGPRVPKCPSHQLQVGRNRPALLVAFPASKGAHSRHRDHNQEYQRYQNHGDAHSRKPGIESATKIAASRGMSDS